MDIVERLRRKGERIGIPCPDNIKGCAAFHFRIEIDPDCAEAAEEIERLHQKHKDMVSRLKWVVNEYNDLLKDYNQLLAKALGEKE